MTEVKHLKYKEKSNSTQESVDASITLLKTLINQGWVVVSHAMAVTIEQEEIVDWEYLKASRKDVIVYHYSIILQKGKNEK